MRTSTATVLATALALGGLAMASCSTEPEGFDVAGLQQELFDDLLAVYTDSGMTLFGVDCPLSAVDAVAGDVFACTADVERQFVRIQVEMDGLEAYTWTTLDVALTMDQTEELVAGEMAQQLSDSISLDCGSPNLRVLPIGASIACEATDSGRNTVTALLTVNGPGQTAWRLVR